MTPEQKELIVHAGICLSSVAVGCLIGASVVVAGIYKRVKAMAKELNDYKHKYGPL